jgi:hypothetical protein
MWIGKGNMRGKSLGSGASPDLQNNTTSLIISAM